MAPPAYYRLVLEDGYETDILAVLMAAQLPPAVTLAIKHLFRCGHKDGESELADITKAIEYLSRHGAVLEARASREAMAEAAEQAERQREAWDRYQALRDVFRGVPGAEERFERLRGEMGEMG